MAEHDVFVLTFLVVVFVCSVVVGWVMARGGRR